MKIKTLFSAVILHTCMVYPINWTQPNSGDWGLGSNWAGGTAPNAAGAVAAFPGTNTAAATITLMTVSPTVGTISFDNTSNFSYAIAPSGSNVLTFSIASGNAALNLNVNSPAGTGGQSISAPVTLTSNLVVNQNAMVAANTFTFSGVVSGAGSLTIGGANMAPVILSAANNTYSGGTILNSGGILQSGVANTLPATGAVTINAGGTLNVNGNSQTIGPLAGLAGASITLGAGTLTTNTTTSTTYAGTISGNGGLTLGGSGGTLILSGANTYDGTTTVNSSTLQLGAANALPAPGGAASGAVTVNSPGILNLNNFSPTIGNLSGNGSVTLGTGILTTNPTSATTFSGVISGAGGLNVGGTVVFMLSGNNTYTGTTTISAMADLQLGITKALYSGVTPGPVAVAGTLDMSLPASVAQSIGPLTGTGSILLGTTQLTLNNPTSSSWGGIISGVGTTGTVTVAGPANITFTASNTYTGGTIITGGSLTSGIPNALAPTGNLTVNSPGTFNLNGNAQTVAVLSGNGSITLGGAAFTVNTPSAMTSNFSGIISQTGVLDVTGPGLLNLTGANTYGGPTNVSAGASLQGNTTSLQGTINNAGNVIFNQTFNGTFTGTLAGAGNLFVTGGANLTLPGTQTEGTTTVLAGELILGTASNLISPTVTIASGGSLGTTGTGMITGNVTVNGTTDLGLGTIHVIGNYTETANSTFSVDVLPTASGLLPVTGTVTLSGAPAIDIYIDTGTYAATQTYTLITAGAPVSGTFAAPVFENPFFEGSLIYNAVAPGSVQLLLEIGPFSRVIKGGNAGAIAKCINPLAFPSGSDLLPIINTLIFLPVDKVKDALDAMQPSQLKAFGLAEENNLVTIRTAVSQRIDDLNRTDCNQNTADLYKWSFWSNFSGDIMRQEGHSQNVGFDVNTAAATVGFDVEPVKDLFVGLAAAYDYSWLEWNHSQGHGTISSVYGGPYLSWFNRRVFLSFSALGTWNNFHASRHIVFPTVDRHALSDHHGLGVITHFDIGIMTYPAAEMTFSPIGGLDYIYLREQGYKEHGAGSLNMKVHETHAALLRSELGFKIAKCAILAHNKWTQDLKLSWIHQHFIKGKRLHAEFAEVDCVYTVIGMKPNQDYFNVAAGITGYFMKDKLSGGLRYEGKFGDGILDNTVYAQLIYRF